VRLIISPASLETAQACLAAGFYETFLSAGAMVVVPGGGPGSAGGGAIFGDGERIASTAEYHRHLDPGQGSPEVHLLGPAAAAVAATEGRLQDPAEFLA
jgi:homoaconitase/3-isopropylmalate dehydratase large subunit